MGNVERADNADNKQTKKQRLSHQDPAPLHLTVWFPDVTASVFFEVPAVAAADAFDIAYSSHMQMRQPYICTGGIIYYLNGNSIPHWDKRYRSIRRDSVWNYVSCR